MDSVTQATLGAAVAHTCWNRQLGRSALLWGGALGTLPDLDIILYPFLDDVQSLYWHRGESHSLLFILLGSLVIGWLFWKKKRTNQLTIHRATAGMFLIFTSHIAIDYFNVYGTQLLAPFSRYGFGNGNLFIIDPLYTGPLLIGVIIAAISTGKFGRQSNFTGIVMSCFYILFSFVSHSYADLAFKRQLEARNIEVLNSLTGATPLNTFLWRHIARTEEGILIGYFSIIGNRPDEEIQFDMVRRNEYLIEPYQDQRNVQAIEWFSKGFWVAEKKNDGLTLSDLRFGEFRFSENDPPDKWQYVFVWEITDNPDVLSRKTPAFRDSGAAIQVLWKRLTGSI